MAGADGQGGGALRIEVATRTLWRVLGFAGGVWLVVRLWQVVLLLAVAAMLVGALQPFVARLELRGWTRARALTAVFAVLVCLVAGLGLLTLPPLVEQVTQLVSRAPDHRDAAVRWLEGHSFLAPLSTSLQGADVNQALARGGRWALQASQRALLVLGFVVTAIFLAAYLMADRERVRGALYALVPRRHHLRTAHVLASLERIVGGYVRGQVITSACLAAFTFAVLTALDVPQPVPLAVFAGITGLVPFVGGLLATVPLALVAAGAHGLSAGLAVLALLVAYQEFESRILVPRVYGRTLRLPAASVIVAVLCGGALLGIVGALLALPTAAALRMLVRELRVPLPGDDGAHAELHGRDARDAQDYERLTRGASAKEAAAVATQMAARRREEEERAAPPHLQARGGAGVGRARGGVVEARRPAPAPEAWADGTDGTWTDAWEGVASSTWVPQEGGVDGTPAPRGAEMERGRDRDAREDDGTGVVEL